MSNTTMAPEAVAGNAFLLEDILLRLPAKWVTRSKLVSKQWCSLISDPRFVQSHCCRKPNNYPTGMFFVDCTGSYNEVDFVSFRGLHPFRRIPSFSFLDGLIPEGVPNTMVLQFCNGLFLCLISTLKSEFSFYSYYCVCNPNTKKYRLIHEGDHIDHITLAYDPSVSPYYKVIFKQSHGYDIYSLKDRCPRQYFDSSFHPQGHVVSLNGSIYWVSFYQKHTFCFDIDTEKMTRIPMPPKPRPDIEFYKCLRQCGGHVYCTGTSYMDSNFYIFKMDRIFSEWVLVYHVSVCSMVDKFPGVVFEREQTEYRFSVRCVIEGFKQEDPKVVLTIPGIIVSYNLKNNTAKKLCHLQFEHITLCTFPFIKTLSYV